MSNHIPTEPATGLLRREAFVTVGATAAFRSLIDASISLSFLSTLSRLGYTHLTIQCGPDLAYFNEKFEAEKDSLQQPLGSLKIRTFDFNTLGLGQEMRGCKGVPGTSREGVVVCHAGAGTILDAMRIGVPLIVVPNTDLLDNHQAELAVELEKQGYVTHGKLSGLAASLEESEKKGSARTAWPPVNSGEKGIMAVVDAELGYEARTREVLD